MDICVGDRSESRRKEQEDEAHRAQVRRCLPQAPCQGILWFFIDTVALYYSFLITFGNYHHIEL